MDNMERAYLILLTNSVVALEELEHQNYGRARELLLRAQTEAAEILNTEIQT